MDKRYQVFVSSTFEDLQEERKEVMQALLELDCIPAGMELFPASNEDQWTLIKRVIDDCDYYLLIIGGRYGSTNDEGKSYTQMEFEYALEQGKPIISFLPKQPENIPAGKSERDETKREKLENFKKLAQKKMIKFWTTPADLGSVVSRSMIQLIKLFPSEGWVKAGSAVDEKSLQEIARLQRENEALKRQISTIATKAPDGTENLSQGDEPVTITYSFEAYNDNAFYDDHQKYNNASVLTWNQLFSAAAPSMLNESSEELFRKNIGEYIEKHCNWKACIHDVDNYESFRDFSITTESFGVVKVQFRALGLIELSTKKRSPSDKETYWKLTPYGDYIMTKILARKKE